VLLHFHLAILPDQRFGGGRAQFDHNPRPTIAVRTLNGRRRAQFGR
jgi:hypothetical protein